MTKDEAIYRLTWAKDLSEMTGMVPIGAETRKAIDAAISAMRGPEPEPDTGLMKCDYCNGGGEQKPLFHENNYEPHTCMQSYIEISESSYGKKPLICVDLWDGANACAAFEINFCPMCGRKLEVEG